MSVDLQWLFIKVYCLFSGEIISASLDLILVVTPSPPSIVLRTLLVLTQDQAITIGPMFITIIETSLGHSPFCVTETLVVHALASADKQRVKTVKAPKTLRSITLHLPNTSASIPLFTVVNSCGVSSTVSSPSLKLWLPGNGSSPPVLSPPTFPSVDMVGLLHNV